MVRSDTALIATTTALYRTALSTGSYETVLTSEDGWSAARLYVDKGSDNAYLITGGPLPDDYQMNPMSIDADPYVDMPRTLWRSEDAGVTWRRESIDGILELAIGESHAAMAVTENGLVKLD